MKPVGYAWRIHVRKKTSRRIHNLPILLLRRVFSLLHINQKHIGKFEWPVRIHFRYSWARVFQNLKIKY